MPAAPLPPDEPERLTALRSLHLLDTAAEPAFDRIASLAQSLSGAKTAFVTLVDAERVWTKAEVGAEACGVARADSFCAHAILGSGVMWVEDASVDPRLHDQSMVVGERGLRFYAGAPLASPEGYRLGTVCVFDTEPRAYDADLAAQLSVLAEIASDECQLRRARLRLAQTAEAQAVAEQSIREFVRQTPIAFALLDLDMKVVEASPRLLKDYGVAAQDMIGRSFGELYGDPDAVRAVHARCIAGERVKGEAAPYTLSDGAIIARDWEAAPWRDRAGNIVGTVLVTNDVTELHRSRAAARRSEDRLTRALHIADTLVWELTFTDQKLRWSGDPNRFFDRAIGFAELSGEGLATIVCAEDVAGVEAAWHALLESGDSYRVEHRMARKDREVWVLSAAELYRNAAGRPERIIGVLKDITERKRHELALAASRLEAEAADRAKSEFLANMSHEIRTPLNGVVGVAGALKRTPLQPAQREMVKLIETSGQVLERLLADVLDLARVESGQLTMREEPFDLDDLVHEVCALFEPNAHRKGLSFNLVMPHSPYRLIGDPLRIRQVLSNLCSNAVKFTEQGEIYFRVQAGRLEGGRVELIIRVIDTGIGFGEEAKHRLFERFEQADGSITRRFGGTGLGLAISRALAERMGGRLEARSEPGRGSTFTFTVALPLADALEPSAPSPTVAVFAEALDEEARAVRVLLAEDHEINRRVVQLILGAAGVDLTMVCDGAEAVRAEAEGAFDLILMDMQMPVMDGLTAIRAIRAAERARGGAPTPIVALTANAMPEHAAASRAAGADDHLTKPVTADALLRLVRGVQDDDAQPEPVRRSA